MYRKLIVPLDGSELAERVLPYAVRLAIADNGRLVLVRVALAPPPPTLDGAGWEQMQTDTIAEAQSYLDGVAARLGTRVPFETVVPYGHAAEQILNVVQSTSADGIAMATHGRTGVPHLLHGSVAEAILAHSPVPVFLVHALPEQAIAAPFDPQTARLMVPLDGSEFSETAITTAIDMLGTSGELVLMCVLEAPEHVLRDDSGRVLAYIDQQEENRKLAAKNYLGSIAAAFRVHHPGAHITTDVRIGIPVSGIVTAAKDRVVDLIVMSTHGRTGVKRALLGSVAGDVLRAGSIPVLLVHPEAVAAEADERREARQVPWVVA